MEIAQRRSETYLLFVCSAAQNQHTAGGVDGRSSDTLAVHNYIMSSRLTTAPDVDPQLRVRSREISKNELDDLDFLCEQRQLHGTHNANEADSEQLLRKTR